MSILKLFALALLAFHCEVSHAQTSPAKFHDRLVVATDGSGDFRSVQAAVDAVPANRDSVTTIFIRAGEFDGIVRIAAGKNRIRLVGEDRQRTVITGVNNERLNPSGGSGPRANLGRALMSVDADDVVIENLTVRNATPYKGSQAEAVRVNGDRCVLRNADFHSFQDTLLLNGRVYATNCLVEGDVDFLWGYGSAFFERCEIKALHQGYHVMARTPAGQPGFLFADCRLTAAADVKQNWLARIEADRFPHSQVAFLRCQMGAHIPAAGWLVTGTNISQLRFGEFQTTDAEGKAADMGQRHPASKQLNAAEAAALSDAARVLGGKDVWNPKAFR